MVVKVNYFTDNQEQKLQRPVVKLPLLTPSIKLISTLAHSLSVVVERTRALRQCFLHSFLVQKEIFLDLVQNS